MWEIAEWLFKAVCLICSGWGVGLLAAGYDAERHKDDPGLNHKSRLFFRSVWMVCVPFGFLGWSVEAFVSGAVLALSFYLIFDPAFNILIGQKIEYLGTTAKTDNLLRKIGGRAALRLEALLWLTVCLAYLYYQMPAGLKLRIIAHLF